MSDEGWPVFDAAHVLARHGSEAALKVLAPMALKTLTETRSVLESPLALPQDQARVLHKMRGNALEFGLRALAESTKPLELALRGLAPAGDATPVDELRARCLAQLAQAEAALQPWLR